MVGVEVQRVVPFASLVAAQSVCQPRSPLQHTVWRACVPDAGSKNRTGRGEKGEGRHSLKQLAVDILWHVCGFGVGAAVVVCVSGRDRG